MKFQKDLLKKILIQNKVLTEKKFNQFFNEAKETQLNLIEYLIEKKIITEESFYKNIADYFKMPFIILKDKIIRRDILNLIPEPIAHVHRIIVFDKTNQECKIATTNPQDFQIIEFIKKKIQGNIKIFVTTPKSIDNVIQEYHKGLKSEFKEINKISIDKAIKNDNQKNEKLKQLAEDLPIVRIVDTLLEYAIFEKCSDIHIEPLEKETIVRYRIDGIMRKVMTLPKNTHAGIVARIKVLSNLKLDEHRLPQDGRFKIKTSEYQVSFRVSIIPIFDGEKVVIRILDEKSQILSLKKLGLQEQPFEIIKRNIEKPHGIILVTGPTGSGKTTTLYSILNVLNKPSVNISTIEDPIEYRMPGINQSQVSVKAGFTFASGLRAFLRQDPDIIMVGEIRDEETAEIAVNAAMTGHLVLSTLHTNDAVTTIPRLSDMKVPSFLISTTINCIIAQRLVRKICQNCITSYKLTKEMREDLSQKINIDSILKMLKEKKIIANKDLKNLLFYKGKGCKKCNNEGYKGRIGIYEILEITPEIKEAIDRKASSEELRKIAKKQNMLSILEDGFIKAKNGITTIEEVLRVIKE
ncbi:MAG: AAA family ATPase [Xanthomonadaceae bacterium]|nr:AAA family ATPase [Rhodospirillaceae bacterium]NIA18046.1 AAA family ATPase [Xanthomonadaceae bacterium]